MFFMDIWTLTCGGLWWLPITFTYDVFSWIRVHDNFTILPNINNCIINLNPRVALHNS